MAVRGISIFLFNAPLEKSAVIYLVFMILILLHGLHPSSIGFSWKGLKRNFLLGSIISICLFTFLRVVDVLTYSLITHADIKLWLRLDPLNVLDTLLFQYICVAISEELLFRGLIQASIARVGGFLEALVISSSLFGIWHLLWGIPRIGLYSPFYVIEYSISYMILSTFWGVVVGSLYHQTQHMGSSIAMHGLWNTLSSIVGISFSPRTPITLITWIQIQFTRHILQAIIASTFGLMIVKGIKKDSYSPTQI
jgi:membrane protease YdiL (CAAX protease family)